MNDRFKFRAYNRELRKMYEVDTICSYEDNHTKGGEVFLKGIQYNSFYFPEEAEVMQCTGKRDCDGNLIYENDIVRLSAKNGMKFDYLVVYKNYQYILEYINGKLKGTKARDFYKEYAQTRSLYEHGYKVIGNIYQDSHLLEN